MINFLRKLLGTKNESKLSIQQTPGTKVLMKTNAPSHWPRLESDPSIVDNTK